MINERTVLVAIPSELARSCFAFGEPAICDLDSRIALGNLISDVEGRLCAFREGRVEVDMLGSVATGFNVFLKFENDLIK